VSTWCLLQLLLLLPLWLLFFWLGMLYGLGDLVTNCSIIFARRTNNCCTYLLKLPRTMGKASLQEHDLSAQAPQRSQWRNYRA